jgi:hypothetical protein
VDEGYDRGRYVNVDFWAADPTALWAKVRSELRAAPEMAGAAIACCQGERGWDDYLLLHHFEPDEPLDQPE